MCVYACICKYMYICAMSMFRDVHICICVCNGNAMCVSTPISSCQPLLLLLLLLV